jgi:hypothetical protein
MLLKIHQRPSWKCGLATPELDRPVLGRLGDHVPHAVELEHERVGDVVIGRDDRLDVDQLVADQASGADATTHTSEVEVLEEDVVVAPVLDDERIGPVPPWRRGQLLRPPQ